MPLQSDFCLKSRPHSPAPELLRVSRSLRGHYFPSTPVWERVRGELLASLPAGENGGRQLKKGLTGHFYWCCEMQNGLKRVQSCLLKIPRDRIDPSRSSCKSGLSGTRTNINFPFLLKSAFLISRKSIWAYLNL
ncbi:hypothetical protein CHARACLAT_006774 [Characodon lateralis]|uniref:Uncharacterized protein n=1 Tax=Characodon lateralis TaxID=208331 RepID=A0ABU7ERZ3_9TELE|nr:hypothetical protein [Characodon lateralis]